jgi:hypothetical protein
MDYIFESFFVGTYSSIIFLIISRLIKTTNINTVIFVTGFMKHLLGYLLHIHSYYCNHGSACDRKSNTDSYTTNPNPIVLLSECVLEGALFILFYKAFTLLLTTNGNTIYIIFATGFMLHILAEKLGVHKNFCKTKCTKK